MLCNPRMMRPETGSQPDSMHPLVIPSHVRKSCTVEPCAKTCGFVPPRTTRRRACAVNRLHTLTEWRFCPLSRTDRAKLKNHLSDNRVIRPGGPVSCEGVRFV